MKVRMGFISNSSSSSFIVGFPKVPKSIDELQEMLFGKEQVFPNPFYYPEHNGDTRSWPAYEIAEDVWNDMVKRGHRANNRMIIDELLQGWFDEFPEKEKTMSWEEYDDVITEAARKLWENRKGDFKDTKVFIFEYEDHTTKGSAMEHGDLFRRLPHIRVSKH